jgi:hypothetical protein
MKKITNGKKDNSMKFLATITVFIVLTITGILISKGLSKFDYLKYSLNTNEIVYLDTNSYSKLENIFTNYLIIKNYNYTSNYVLSNTFSNFVGGLEFVYSNFNVDPLILISIFYNKSYFTNINMGSINWDYWNYYYVPEWYGTLNTNSITYNVVMSGFIYSYYYNYSTNNTQALISYLGIRNLNNNTLENSMLYEIINDYNTLIEIKF